MPEEILYQSENYRVEWHRSNDCQGRLVYSFTPFNFTNLDHSGFGVSYLLKNGFDVVAFKCQNNSWYQDIDAGILREIGKIGERYTQVSAYGSSMGAYAAIAFSGILKPDTVLAISPQYAIDQQFDKRWAIYADRIWNYRICRKSLGDAEFIIIYDNMFAPDIEQIIRLKKVIPSEKLNEIALPFSGHASSAFLHETKQLTSTVAKLLVGRKDVVFLNGWETVKQSKTFFKSLGMYAEKREKVNLSEYCYRRMIALDPNYAEGAFILSRLLFKRGYLEEAIEYAEKAVELAPEIFGFRQHLKQLRER